MSKTKFTPGPWVARIEDRSFCDTGDVFTFCAVAQKGASKYDLITEVFTINDDTDEALANTRLIASAPEMYWILEHYLDLIQRANDGDAVSEQKIFEQAADIEKVLKKARGEE